MAWLVFAIAIPFFMIEPTSLPLTVGILAGLMWVPFSWMLQHWVGLFHAIARTVLVLAAWYLFPEHRFVAILAVIVVIYLVTIYLLAKRGRRPRDPVGGRLPAPRGPAGLSAPIPPTTSRFRGCKWRSRFGTSQRPTPTGFMP
jgi:hypothetical protein